MKYMSKLELMFVVFLLLLLALTIMQLYPHRAGGMRHPDGGPTRSPVTAISVIDSRYNIDSRIEYSGHLTQFARAYVRGLGDCI